MAVLRNLAAMMEIKNKTVQRIVEWILILLGVALGVIFNNRGLLGWLPIAANLEYSVSVFYLKDREQWLKLAFVVNMLMYSVFSFVIINYVGAVANIVTAVITAVSLIRDARAAKKEKNENGLPEEAE